jgi:hypothetical protein
VLDVRVGPDLAPAAWRHDNASDAQLSPHGDTINLEQLNVGDIRKQYIYRSVTFVCMCVCVCVCMCIYVCESECVCLCV